MSVWVACAATRRQNVVPIVSSNTDINIDVMAAQDSDLPDKVIGRAQMRALLERKLDELPEPFRLVFVLRSVEDMDVEDTARCLSIAEATVRSGHYRAQSLLRESLAHEIDLAEPDAFEFAGTQCDAVIAQVLARLVS